MANKVKEPVIRILTPVSRLSFPALIKPEKVMGQGEPKFQVQLIIKKDDPKVAALREAIKSVGVQKWGTIPPNVKNPLKDGDKKVDKDGKPIEHYKGCYIISAKSGAAYPPNLIDGNVRPLKAEAFYAGSYVVCSINITTYDNQFGRGITCYLNTVQFYKDGDKFGNHIRPEDEFQVVEGFTGDSEISDSTPVAGDDADF